MNKLYKLLKRKANVNSREVLKLALDTNSVSIVALVLRIGIKRKYCNQFMQTHAKILIDAGFTPNVQRYNISLYKIPKYMLYVPPNTTRNQLNKFLYFVSRSKYSRAIPMLLRLNADPRYLTKKHRQIVFNARYTFLKGLSISKKRNNALYRFASNVLFDMNIVKLIFKI